MKPIDIILADDHEIFRNGLKELISKETDLRVVGEAADGESALQLAEELTADILILDIRMPKKTGIEAGAELAKKNLDLKIIIFSLYENEEYVVQALRIGASGYLLKDTSNKVFLDAIRRVHKGEFYYIGEVSDIVIRYLKESTVSNDTVEQSEPKVQLSKREKEILMLIKSGQNSKEVALELGLSVRTVDAHRFNILRKFSAKNIGEVVKMFENTAQRGNEFY